MDWGCKLPTALQPAVVCQHCDCCSPNALVAAVLTPACKLRGPALTESLDRLRVRHSGPNHTPCAKNTLPVSEKVDFGLSAGPIFQTAEAPIAQEGPTRLEL